MTKRQASRILYRIYEALKAGNVKVQLNRKLDPVFGCTSLEWDGTVTIEINPIKKGAKGGMMSTILHECLHLVSWGKREGEIIEMEEEIFKLLTDRQLSQLFKRVAAAVCKK